MLKGVTFLLLFTSVTVAASVAQLAQKRYSSLSRRTQELLTKAIEFTRMPRYSVVDATVELNWAKRLRAKDFIAKRNGIYAAQLSRYQRHRHELTAKFFYDRIVHYRIDGKSYIGIADRHAQPEDVRLLSIGGQEISIAEHVSGVLVWDHINYDKRVALKLQDGQYLYASGAVNIPANTDMMYGTVDGVFSDDYHLVKIEQVQTNNGELLELSHTMTFIAPRLSITSFDDKHGELRSLL